MTIVPEKFTNQDKQAIEKLDKMMRSIAEIQDDKLLQQKINDSLPPLIRNVNRGHSRAQKKHIETLDSLTEIVKKNEVLTVPFAVLIRMYLNSSATENQQRYALRFIRLGFPRMTIEQKIDFINVSIDNFVDEEKWCQDSLLILIVKLLNTTCTVQYRGELHPCHNLRSKTILKNIFLQYLLDVLVLPYDSLTKEFKDWEETEQKSYGCLKNKNIPKGISESSYRKLIVNGKLVNEEIEDCKMGILKFIFSDIFDLNDFFMHTIVAAGDQRFSIAEMANDKKDLVYNHMDWNSEATADLLYNLFLGEEPNFDEIMKESVNRTDPSPSVKLEILQVCMRLKRPALVHYATIHFLIQTTNFQRLDEDIDVRMNNFNFAEYCLLELDETQDLEMVNSFWAHCVALIRYERESPEIAEIYKLIRVMVRRYPPIVFGQLTVIRACFDQLEEASEEFAVTVIERTLLVLIDSFRLDAFARFFPPERFQYRRSLMESMFIDYLKSKKSRVRMMAMKFLREIFGFESVRTIFAFVQLGTSEKVEDEECVREAFMFLYGAYKSDVIGDAISFRRVHFPDPIEMVNYAVDMLSKSMDMETKDPVKMEQNGNILSYHLIYLRFCLLHGLDEPLTYGLREIPSICTPGVVEAYKSYRTDKKYADLKLRKFASLCEYYAEVKCDLQSIRILTELMASGMPYTRDEEVEQASWYKRIYDRNSPGLQEATTTLVASIYVNYSVREFETKLRSILMNSKAKKQESVQANMLVCAKALERWHFRRNGSAIDVNIVTNVVQTLTKQLLTGGSNERFLSQALYGIILLGQSSVISRISGHAADTKQKLLKILLEIMIDKTKSDAIHKQSVKALSYIGVGETAAANRHMIEMLLKSITPKLVEFKQMFEVAELLVQCVAGQHSREIFDSWKCQRNRDNESRPVRCQSIANLRLLVDGLLERLQPTPNPNPNQTEHVKKALAICCLYTLTSFSREKEVRKVADLIYKRTLNLFDETDLMLVEIVSKVLHNSWKLVSDVDERNILIDAFSYRLSVLVDEAKKNPRSETGYYRPEFFIQLVIIARALPVPGLIYQFLEFVCNRGTFHGTKWEFEKQPPVGRELKSHLKKSVPVIYRYRHHMDKKIGELMDAVWKNIVDNTQETLIENFDSMMQSYLKGMDDDLFQNRCSACEAIPQLLAELKDHIPTSKWRPILPRVWKKILPTYEDLYFKARSLGIPEALQILSNLTINDATRNRGDEEVCTMIKLTLMVLVEKSFARQNLTIQSFLLTNIHCLMNVAGAYLKPLMHALVPKLVNLMSISEVTSEQLVQTQQLQLVAQFSQIEAVNDYFLAQISKSCVPFLDETNFGNIMEKLIQMLKSSEDKIGLRIAAADTISIFAKNFPDLTRPYVQRMIVYLEPEIELNRPMLMAKSFANLLGHLLKLCPAEFVSDYINKLKQLFFNEKKSISMQQVLPVAIKSIVDNSPAVYQANIEKILSIIYLAKFQPYDDASELCIAIWQEMWKVYEPREDCNINCLVSDFLNVIMYGLGQSAPEIKTAAARALFDILSKYSQHLVEIWTIAMINLMFILMDTEWYEDKHMLMRSLQMLFSTKPERFEKYYQAQRNCLGDNILKETVKHDTEYKMYAFDTAGTMFGTMKSTRFSDVLDYGWPYLVKPFQHIKREEKRVVEEKLRMSILNCLKATWPTTDAVYQEEMLMKYLMMLLEGTPFLTAKLFDATYSFFEHMFRTAITLQATRIVYDKIEFFQEFTGRLTTVMSFILICDRPYLRAIEFIENMLANKLVLQNKKQLEGVNKQLLFLKERKCADFMMHAYLIPRIDALIKLIDIPPTEPQDEQ